MTLKKKLTVIFKSLRSQYGPQSCHLTHQSPFQLLVSVILSAQCTDKKVNSVTPDLFRKYPNAQALADANILELATIIRPIGLFRIKSANLAAAAKKINSAFSGKVPDSLKDLTSLPGVGRKTANVVLGNAFGIPAFPVDTHVIRLMNRIGIIKTPIPEKIEAIVIKHMPDKYWTEFSHLLIAHGRNCCRAPNPECRDCIIHMFCNRIGVQK